MKHPFVLGSKKPGTLLRSTWARNAGTRITRCALPKWNEPTADLRGGRWAERKSSTPIVRPGTKGARYAIVKAVWAEGATYMDPTVHLTGVAELVKHIALVLRQHPGSRIVRTSTATDAWNRG